MSGQHNFCHKNEVFEKNEVRKSGLCAHIVDSGHEVEWDKSTILFKENNWRRRCLIESAVMVVEEEPLSNPSLEFKLIYKNPIKEDVLKKISNLIDVNNGPSPDMTDNAGLNIPSGPPSTTASVEPRRSKRIAARTSRHNSRPEEAYEVSKYTWENDRGLSKRLSATLRTRDSLKYWYQCEAKHLYVNKDGESCIDCVEVERAKSWADSSEDFLLRKITKKETSRDSLLPQVAGIMTGIKRRSNQKRGQWQQKEQQVQSTNFDFDGNQRHHFDTYADNNWRKEPDWRQERSYRPGDSAQEGKIRWNKERVNPHDGVRGDECHKHDNRPLLLPSPDIPFQPGFDPFHEKDSRKNEKDWKGKDKQSNHTKGKKNRKK